ncbi:MAG: excinuclease ABC subunit UvrC [Patescibacteria group bacterium]|jgi:excinuclease ABC subunit C
MNQEVLEKVKKLPQGPGIYKFKDSSEEVIYVGKAKNLRSRVGSYFHANLDPTGKTAALVAKIANVEYVEVFSEIEALILEAEFIKKYYPKYNIIMKDDKSYIYVVIRNEKLIVEGKKTLLPVLLTARESDLQKSDKVFGPFPSSYTTKYIVRTIRKFLPYRDCSLSKFIRYHKLNKPCLYGHIGLCQAPCVDLDTAESYRKDIKRIERFLGGKADLMLRDLNRQMKQASDKKDYESAAKFRDLLQKFDYVRSSFRPASDYVENPYLVEDIAQGAIEALAGAISILNTAPRRIECYDISNISGKEATGSMVVATEGRLDKSQYRKFRIKQKDTPDDFGMMREVLERRMRREVGGGDDTKNWGTPDLIVLDGGRGQVSVILELFKEIGVSVPVVGLAKRFENVVFRNKEGVFEELSLARDSEGLKLLIRLRDEAHRFAQAYHHRLRKIL